MLILKTNKGKPKWAISDGGATIIIPPKKYSKLHYTTENTVVLSTLFKLSQ